MATTSEIFLEVWAIFICLLKAIYSHALRIFGLNKQKSLRGEVAIVTGAGHGIGKEISLQLADQGAKVICWDIYEKTAHETAQNIRRKGGVAWAVRCDVGDRQDVIRAAQETR